MNVTRKTCITGKLPPPVGTSEWETFSQKCICVDKTWMIKELVDRVTTVALFTRPAYRVKSNGESGEGRYDLMLRPIRAGYPGYVIEIKAARRKNANLKNLAAAALRQIRRHAYRAELEAEGCGEIVALGLAFRGKRAVLRKG